MIFEKFFHKATTYKHYPYQVEIAERPELPVLLRAPTGTGKTEAVILAWLWRRLYHPDESVKQSTPRRLVYCLPMRTLVEQTQKRIEEWLTRLGFSDDIYVETLMGGEVSRISSERLKTDWRLNPHRTGILVGTQDMLLSRVLNRGYGMSHFAWPWEFGLLSNDCLWVMDEVQLMANGLPTSTQLAALRDQLGTYGAAKTIWMSATVSPEWLHTVDFREPNDSLVKTLDPSSLDDERLHKRNKANKTLSRLEIDGRPSTGSFYNYNNLAAKVKDLHQPGTLTLVVVNTVERAQAIYTAVAKLNLEAETVLVHSRFRPAERKEINEQVAAEVSEQGTGRIVVATQAVEAGVDISARTLITELAPWPSLVQRFGRCNREGKFDTANVYWLDVPENSAPPYEAADLDRARDMLVEMEGRSVGPAKLPAFDEKVSHKVVLRRRDMLGLFDTTPDLSGNYLDVSRYVRGSDETDVQVFWRAWQNAEELAEIKSPSRDELCSVSIGQLKAFMEKNAIEIKARRWDYIDGKWESVSHWEVRPGQTLMLHVDHGGYTSELGWHSSSTSQPVESLYREDDATDTESSDHDASSIAQKKWISLTQHSLDVRGEAAQIISQLDGLGIGDDVQQAVINAAQYHDLGKAHPVFQCTMLSNLSDDERVGKRDTTWAKQGKGNHRGRRSHSRPHFRHELASALVFLKNSPHLDDEYKDLTAYLIAAHHGQVRLSIRSRPRDREDDRDAERKYLLGFSMNNDDTLPPANLGDGVTTPETIIDVSIAEIGVREDGERSWLDRTLELRDRLGIFKLAYLEALVRAADVRASIKEELADDDHND